jgi:peptidoglycan/LPS O-acetylase OafA/YrhL
LTRLGSSTRESSLEHRPDIDGLRALAILAVLGFHAAPEIIPGGFVGVDVFFVISGYLITRILVTRLREDRFSLLEFYARRIRRIFPALIVVLAACLILGWFQLLAGEYEQLGRHVAAATGFVVNLVLSRESGYFDTSAALKPLLHVWSLGVEEQFYIVWPLLLWLAWKSRVNLLALLLSIVAVSYWWSIRSTPADAAAAFYSPLTRFWELGLGCSLAVRRTAEAGDSQVSRPLANLSAIVGLLLIAVAMLGLDTTAEFPGWRAILPTMGGFLLIYAGSQAWINRLLSHRWLVWIGLISYPLYLWHWPLLAFAQIQASTPIALPTRLGLVALSVLLAWLTFEWIERPSRQGHGGTVRALVASMAAIGFMGAYTVTSKGFDHRFPASLRAYANFQYAPLTGTRPGCWVSASAPFNAYPESCIEGADTFGADKPLMIVWGDSYAARLYAGVSQVHGRVYRLAQFTRDSCPPLLDSTSYSSCRDANAFVLRKLVEARPAVVVLFAYWQNYAEEWRADSAVTHQLLATIAALTRNGVARVIVVGPPPRWRKALPKLLFEAAVEDAPLHRVPGRMRVGAAYGRFESSFRQLLVGQPSNYVSLHDALCDEHGCLTRVADGVAGIVSWDYGHFTTSGAAYVAQRLLVNTSALPDARQQ